MSATIRDVARLANVGIGTVSRVINDSPAVTDETRAKVLEAIDELDYSPNPIARTLSTGQTLTIGVILPYLTMPSYAERLRGVQQTLTDSAYDLILFVIENPSQRDAYFKNLSLKSRVDGVLFISLPPDDKQAESILHSKIPAVLIDGYHPDLSCVYPDDVQGGRIATQHLIELGHRRIGFLSDHLHTPFHPSMRLRYKGYRGALEDAGITFNPDYQVEGGRGRLNARSMARKLLSLHDPPTAIFAAYDSQAIGTIETAREMGFKVPEDLSVIGYDDIRDAEYLNLTTINQHLDKSGIEGAKLLLEMLANSSNLQHHHQTISVDLVIRGTTKSPKNHKKQRI